MNKSRLAAAMVIALTLAPLIPAALAAGGFRVEVDSEYYMPGDIVSISGKSDADATVTVTVTNSDETVYTEEVSADSEGEYLTNFTLAADPATGRYEIAATSADDEAYASFTVEALTVETDARCYKPGFTVTITGEAAADASVEITVTNTLGTFYTASVTADADGAYSTSFTLADDAHIGVYKVKAAVGDEEADARFEVRTVLPSDYADSELQVVLDLKLQVENLFAEMEAASEEIPEGAQSSYERGVEFLEKAENLLAAGEDDQAIQAMKVATVHFENAARIANGEDNGHGQRGAGLSAEKQLEMLEKQLERLQEKVAGLEEDGEDVTEAQAALTAAETHLASAQTLLDAGNETDAQTEIDAARESLQQVAELIGDHAMNGNGPMGGFGPKEGESNKYNGFGGPEGLGRNEGEGNNPGNGNMPGNGKGMGNGGGNGKKSG